MEIVKYKILEKYFPELAYEGSYDFENLVELPTLSDGELDSAAKQISPYVEKQRKVFERYVDACLVERLMSEKQFSFLNKLL